ncbi:MAG TPA: CBS domain-containing protein [Candidatus Limnocylindrales bacterium]|jgi:Zn-dependent protease|nr:CBS domain-containing protein [Candidatus Limnocylindrales bacterium]
MRTRFSIGPFFGVRVAVTLSWLFVLLIVVFALEAIGIFSAQLPLVARLGLSLLVGVLFLLSLAVHEIAHALVARRVGVEVREVGLAVIGSQGELERRAATGRGEMAIAVVGPLLSIAIGALVVGLSVAIAPGDDPWLQAAGQIAWLVGLSNLVVGGLNLLPGFPFDGGRLMRGLVLARTGDEIRATRMALLAGRLLAYAMMGFGIAIALTGAFVDGLWLVVLGWLLVQSNRLHQRRHDIELLVQGLHVGDVMEQEFEVVPPGLTVDALLDQHQQRSSASVYPVTQAGALVGTIDIGRVMRVPQAKRLETRVEELMTGLDGVTLLTRPTPVMDALQTFDRSRADALPVVDEEAPRTLVGMLTREGLITALRARRSARRAMEQAR